MNGFQKKAITPIQDKLSKNKSFSWVKSHLFLSVIFLILGFLVIKGIFGAIKMGSPFSIKQIVISAITSGIEMDEYGHTNILLLGIGGDNHDGANLTDTMIVASIDYKNNLVPMLSIPRDLYVENETVGWGSRLNSIYEFVLDKTESHDQAIFELESEIEEMLGMEIHYYAMIDFNGFEDVVDALGGIELEVAQDIYDTSYPSKTSKIVYDPFYIKKGLQTLDGETALKYARSRYSTSDFDRALRQQQVLDGIKNKALSLGFFLNPSKISNMYEAISANLKTNMSLNEIINLAGKANKFSTDSVISEVLNDLAYEKAGFLYTPEREAYGGAFVLIPYVKSFEEIHTFAQLFFYQTDIYLNQTPIQILNGTKTESLAGLTKMYLHRYGFNIVRHGNANEKGIEKSAIYILDPEGLKDDETQNLLKSLTFMDISKEVPLEYQAENWQTEAKIIIVLGEDFAEYYKNNKEFFYLGFY